MFDMLLLLCRRDGCIDARQTSEREPRVEGTIGYCYRHEGTYYVSTFKEN